MAKNIKAIKCPQCGSTKKKEIKPDYFICDNCKTEYFLDNDDIHIHHHNTSTPPPQIGKSALWVVAAILGLLCLGIFLPLLLSRNSMDDFEMPFRFSDQATMVYKNKNNALEYAVLGLHQKGNNDKAGFELMSKVYDSKGKLLKETTYENAYANSSRVEADKFTENDAVYFTINEKDVYRYDTENKTFQFMNPEWEKKPELAAGIVKAQKYHDDKFELVTLSGIKYTFYTLANTIIKSDSAYDYNTNMVLSQPVTRKFYVFEEASLNEAGHLFVYDQTWQKGFYNESYADLEEYFFGPESRKKMGDHNLKRFRITDLKLFTPDRSFFDCDVLCWDDKSVIIAYKLAPTGNEMAIQSLDANSGAVQWSIQPENKHNNLNYINGAAMNDQEVMISTGRDDVITLDRNTGKIKFQTK